ncbi:MAG: hypothetical protein WCQ69_09280 [Bacteroidales bacterium]
MIQIERVKNEMNMLKDIAYNNIGMGYNITFEVLDIGRWDGSADSERGIACSMVSG